MKNKIFILDTLIIEPIVANLVSSCKEFNFELYRIDESEMFNVLKANRYDLALINPLLYGKSMGFADLRILPETCIAHVGFTGMLSLRFAFNSPDLSVVNVQSPNSFVAAAAKILLSERYDLEPDFVKSDVSSSDAANLIIGGQSPENSLDLSEDWYDTFEIPLPLAFWCGKNEEILPEYIQLVNDSKNENLSKEFAVHENIDENTGNYVRSGSIITHWSDEIKSAVEQTLQMLYLRGYFNDIPAVKLPNDDNFLKL